MLTQVTELGSTPLILASAGQSARCASPAGTPMRLPAKSLTPVIPELFSQYMPSAVLA
jgi:hypothetical protein